MTRGAPKSAGVPGARPGQRGWTRRSTRQNRTLHLFGVTGGVTLTGLTDEIATLLPAVEMTGLGLRTTVGMGRVAFLPTRPVRI